MAKMKRLLEYLKGTCELMEDSCTSRKELLEVYREVDPKLTASDFETDFVKHIINEADQTVTYTYRCYVCGIEHEKTMPIETDFVYLGNCPSEDEDVSFKLYCTAYMCRALIDQLRRQFGQEPEGARLRSKIELGADSNEVICEYDTRYPMSMAYAFMLEANPPEHWTNESRRALETMTGIKYPTGKWVPFWFECNAYFDFVKNEDDWNRVKEALKRNNYETNPLDAHASPGRKNKFGLYAEFTDEYTLRDFFNDNNMLP